MCSSQARRREAPLGPSQGEGAICWAAVEASFMLTTETAVEAADPAKPSRLGAWSKLENMFVEMDVLLLWMPFKIQDPPQRERQSNCCIPRCALSHHMRTLLCPQSSGERTTLGSSGALCMKTVEAKEQLACWCWRRITV